MSATFAVALALYGLTAAPVPFFTKAEAREALVVQSMVEGHGLLLPTRDGHIASKPPLFHWLATLAVRAGVLPEELAIRLPSIVSGAAGVAITAGVGTRWFGPTAGLLAASVLASSREWLHAATQSRVDMTLTLALLCTVLAWLSALEQGSLRAVRLGWCAAAVAVLTKGPVGIVLPALVMVVVSAAGGRLARLWRLVDLPAIAMFFLLTAGWYVAAALEGGHTFLARQLVHENLQRFVGRQGHAGHAHPFYYYVPALAVAFLPWTLALPTTRAAPPDPHGRGRALLVWIVTVFVFYSFSAGKRAAYLLPLFPPLALLVGVGLARSTEHRTGIGVRTALMAVAVVCLGAAVAVGLWRERIVAAAIVPLMGGGAPLVATAKEVVAATHRMLALTLLAIGLLLLGTTTPRWRAWSITGLAIAVVVATGVLATAPVARALTPGPFARAMRAAIGQERVCSRVGIDFALRYYFGRHLSACPPPSRWAGPLPPFVIDLAAAPPPPGYRATVADPRTTIRTRLTLYAREDPVDVDVVEPPGTR